VPNFTHAAGLNRFPTCSGIPTAPSTCGTHPAHCSRTKSCTSPNVVPAALVGSGTFTLWVDWTDSSGRQSLTYPGKPPLSRTIRRSRGGVEHPNSSRRGTEQRRLQAAERRHTRHRSAALPAAAIALQLDVERQAWGGCLVLEVAHGEREVDAVVGRPGSGGVAERSVGGRSPDRRRARPPLFVLLSQSGRADRTALRASRERRAVRRQRSPRRQVPRSSQTR
jgi:hypothetical protein